MSRSTAVALKWFSLACALGLLVLLILHAWQAAIATVLALDRAGWSVLVRRPATQPTAWILGCVIAPPCQHAFAVLWTAHYPLWQAAVWVGLVYAGALFGAVANRLRRRSDLLPGAARWAQRNELVPFTSGEASSPQRGYVGILAPSRRRRAWAPAPPMLRLPERLRCSHCLVVGGSGARKTTGYHKPNILLDALDDVSVVIFDVKYPDPKSGFWDCVPYFATRGFDVQLFLPFDQPTLVLPLLGGVETLEDAYDVVDLLLPPPLQEHAANFYRDQERQLLVGLLLGVTRDWLRNSDDPFTGPPSMRRVFRLCLSGIREVERYIHTHPDAQVREAVSGLFGLEDRLLAGISAGVAGRLQLFNDDRLDRATTPPPDPRFAVRLGQLGRAPTLLYVGIPQEKVQGARGQLILQLVKRTIERALLQTADRYGGELPRHVSIYLDEFAAMGPLPNVAETMATMRSRRVAYHLSLQNRAHGEMLYGTTGFRSFFVNNIQTVIIFPRFLKFDDAQYFSNMLGYMTVEQRSTGLTQRGLLGGSRTDWSRDALRPLLPPEEYPDWPEAMGILFTIGARPVRVILPRLDEDRTAGVRNPFAGFRPYLATTGDDVSRGRLIAELIQHHFSWIGTHQPIFAEDSLKVSPRVPSATSPSPPSPAGPASSVAPGDLEPPQPDPSGAVVAKTGVDALTQADAYTGARAPEAGSSLLGWVREVLQLRLPPGAIRAYYHNGRLTRLGVHRVALPAAHSALPYLSTWLAQRWIRVTPVEIALLPRAFPLLPRDHLTALRRAGHLDYRDRKPPGGQPPLEPPEPTASVPLAPVSGTTVQLPSTTPITSETEGDLHAVAITSMEHLRAWVETHGAHLEGHPQRDSQADLLGVYEEGHAVIIRADTVTEALHCAGIPSEQIPRIRKAWRDAGWIRIDPSHLTTVRRLEGKRRRVVHFRWHAWTGTSRSPSESPVHPGR